MTGADVHASGLKTSTALSEYYVPHLITPANVNRVLSAAGVRFMLLGAHGLAGWTKKARATEDVDILVGRRAHRKAILALTTAFPQLEAEDHEVVTRLRDAETKVVAIDILKANQPLYRDALKYTKTIEVEGLTYEIPKLELALATKFSAMLSLIRADEDKLVDASDFIKMVKANPQVNLNQLHVLGQLVYNGGGDELVEKVRQVRAGEKLKL